MTHITVWRTKEGAPLAAYSGAKKGSVRVDQGEVKTISTKDLRDLVSSRAPFEEVHVTLADAQSVLGWEVGET